MISVDGLVILRPVAEFSYLLSWRLGKEKIRQAAAKNGIVNLPEGRTVMFLKLVLSRARGCEGASARTMFMNAGDEDGGWSRKTSAR
jgi:hypothetical protein